MECASRRGLRRAQYKENANAALALLNGTDYALDEMTKVLHRLSELAVQGANGPLNETSLEAIANEVEELRNHLYHIANTKQENTYILRRKRIGPRMNLIRVQPRYYVAWVSNPLKAEVGTGIMMEITVTGDRVFGIQPIQLMIFSPSWMSLLDI